MRQIWLTCMFAKVYKHSGSACQKIGQGIIAANERKIFYDAFIRTYIWFVSHTIIGVFKIARKSVKQLKLQTKQMCPHFCVSRAEFKLLFMYSRQFIATFLLS